MVRSSERDGAATLYAAFSENAIQYQAGLTFITHHLKMMMSAVQG